MTKSREENRFKFHHLRLLTTSKPNILTCYIRVVHGSHSWAIFGSFSISFLAHFRLFGRGTNKKGLKMEPKMMLKMVTVNALGREFQKNGAKMHSSRQAQGQKDEKWSFFSSLFAKARLGFHFIFIFRSFSVSILRKMETKWNGKWFKNEWKMDQKCQLWTTLIYPGGTTTLVR